MYAIPHALCCFLMVLAVAVPPVGARERGAAELTHEQEEWLDRVELLITPQETEYFLSIQEPFRRDAFIEQFWKVRDPDPATARNEFRRAWSERVDAALERYGSVTDARAVMFLFNGEPGRYLFPDGRIMERCYRKGEKTEIWFYGGSDMTDTAFPVYLFAPRFPASAPYRIWLNWESIDAAPWSELPVTNPALFCDADTETWAMRRILQMGWGMYRDLIQEVTRAPVPVSKEWIATFHARTASLPEDAETFTADLAFDFPGRNRSRVAVRGLITVPAGELSSQQIKGKRFHELLITGEIVRSDRLFENFRYRFEVPVHTQQQAVPLVFQRYLRGGPVRILIKVEDLLGHRFATFDRRIEVPEADGLASLRQAPDSALLRLLQEAGEAANRGQTTIHILPPPQSDIQVGQLRVSTVAAGEFRRVCFYLDGKPVLTKQRPPFSVELNLGDTAASHRLRVVAYDETDSEVASDEIVINQGGQRFRVRLVEPRRNRTYKESLSAVVRVEVPDGEELDRVELFLDERRVATLYQPPFVQPVLLQRSEMAYVRAVGYLTDGNATEDVVFINAPDYFEQVEVQFVELYATVSGPDGEALLDLTQEEFEVREDGVEQEILRLEYVRDLSIHAALVLDTSASMEEALPQVVVAAETFVEQAIEPRDRVALVAFEARPRLETRFTNDVSEIAGGLARLRAGGSTAIYDSLVFALHHFAGVKGPKALLLLSDGQDEASHFDLEGSLAVAQRLGVTVYVIGLSELARDRAARKLLRRIARETGGRSYFIEDLAELPAIYEAIQQDLRSQYLIAYQSTSSKDPDQLRLLEVEADRRGSRVRTLSGYYP